MPNCSSVEEAFDKDDKRLGKNVILDATFRYNGSTGSTFFLSPTSLT
jgi:hypothetical protein